MNSSPNPPHSRAGVNQHGADQAFQEAGAGVYFFFLRISEQEIARVEIPSWLAEEPRLVDSIHASVLADSRMTGYSYVLSQAHQHATIPYDLVDVLQTSARACYLAETGHLYQSSAKNRMKGK